MSRLRLGTLLALLPLLAGFTPFTQVTNVCPACRRPQTDVVQLTSGEQIACRVVAQNDDYYVLQRNGELRAAFKSEIASLKWKGGAGAASLGTGDQILQQNGVVLHGAVLQEQAGRYYVIQVGTIKHTVWASQVKSVHKAGKRVTGQ